MIVKRAIELLAPARDVRVGKAAIDSGADAVYIGATQFGARQAAGNSVEEIGELCDYAHLFGVRVWVTMNTILTDEELVQAEALAWELYRAGVDGLIVQDMGLLQMHLPPLRLHASTQCNNATIEKVRWLQEVGFERVVLARELSLEEISAIHAATEVELEVFVHGALCVSYSGQCYLSEAVCGRSANRGACAQMCRQRYDVLDKEGRVLLQDKYVLSLHDMNRSAQLRDVLAAGASSLKIEGRLKDETYVRNVVRYYREQLDAIFAEADSPYMAASRGVIGKDFVPNLEKTFHRGGVGYFLEDREVGLVNMETPKSTGERVGVALTGGRGCRQLRIRSAVSLHNGDGLCYGDKGFSINKIEGDTVWVNQPITIAEGTVLYRNYDKMFLQSLQQRATCRHLPIGVAFRETEAGFSLEMWVLDGGVPLHADKMREAVHLHFSYPKEAAREAVRAEQTVRSQLTKMGDTPFVVEEVKVEWEKAYFLPISVLNDWRRQGVERLMECLQRRRDGQGAGKVRGRVVVYPRTEPQDYRLNICNEKARAFYAACGVDATEEAFEKTHRAEATLMRCKYCLLHELGQCRKEVRKEGDGKEAARRREPAYIRTNGRVFRLDFDCRRCEMRIYSAEAGE